MYYSPIPLLVVRTDADALVAVNGLILGECRADGYAALPIADVGEYYLSAEPLQPGHWGVTRRISFRDGAPDMDVADDVSLYAWPGGVYECELCLGRAGAREAPVKREEPPAAAFFLAVRDGREAEAMAYLSAELRAELSFAALREFLGPFTEVRAPVYADATHVGLLCRISERFASLRLYALSYAPDGIANITEA